MELEHAKQIIRRLAEGVHPTTGELLPRESPYNDASVVRALFTILESVKKTKKTMTPEEKQHANLQNGRPRNAGLPWTDDLREQASSKFKKGETIPSLAKHFERSESAIVSELTRQGLIEYGNTARSSSSHNS